MKKEYGKDMPFTTKEFFEKIRLLLIDNGEMPQNLLDYALSTNDLMQIRDCEFDVKMDVHYGGNEGIYLVMYLEGYIGEYENHGNKRYEKYKLGTFKTLVETKEAFQQMALLGANFIYAARSYVDKNLDDFIWTGYRVAAYDSEGKHKIGYISPTLERARELKVKLEERYPECYVPIIDLAARKEIR